MPTVNLAAPQVAVTLQHGDPATINVLSDDAVPSTLELWVGTRAAPGTALATLTGSSVTGGRSYVLSEEDSLALRPSRAYQLVARDSDTGVTWFTGAVSPSTEGAAGPTSQTVTVALSEVSVTVDITVAAGAGSEGGGTTMPSGTAGQVPQVSTGSTYTLVTPNTANGLVRLDGSATIPEIFHPSTIARDSEVSAAIGAITVDDVDGRDIYNPAIIMSPAFVTASGGSMVNGVSVTIAAFAALIPVGYDILIWNGTNGAAPNGSYTHAGSGVFNYSDRQYLTLASVAAGCVKVVGADQATSGAGGALSEWAISTANGTDFGLYPIGGFAHLVSAGLTLDASGFNGNLATTDNTLQEVAQKVDDLSLGGTVDVVSNVATARVLGRTTSGSGDSEELTAAQTRSLIGVGLHVVADRTIASGGSASESFDVTGLTIVQILFAGASERASTLAALYLTFNNNTSSVYSTDAGAFGANLVLANVPGNNTNTDRFGFVRADLQLLDGFYKSGISSATSFGSTAAVGASVAHRGLFSTITAAVTSLQISTQAGDIAAGSRIIVMGA